MMAPGDVVLMPEVRARRALHGRRIRFSVLRPFGHWFGVGVLRVLRANVCSDESVELIAGYERYELAEVRP